MQWLRLYHGTSKDPKLAACARKARCLRAEVVAVWVFALEHASEATDRGSVADLTAEIISVTFDMDEEVVQTILNQFRERGMISGDRIAAWDKRQRRTDDVADRVRKHRKKAKDSDETDVTETQNHVTETERNANVTLHDAGNQVVSTECNVTPSVLFFEQNLDDNNTARVEPVLDAAESVAEHVNPAPSPKPPGRDPNDHAVIQGFSDAIVQVFGEEHARLHPHNTDEIWAHRFMVAAAEVSIPAGKAIDMLRQHFVDQLMTMRNRGNSPPKVLKFFHESAAKILRDYARDRDEPTSRTGANGSSFSRKPSNGGDVLTSTHIPQKWEEVRSALVRKQKFSESDRLKAVADAQGNAAANILALSMEEQVLGKKPIAARAA